MGNLAGKIPLPTLAAGIVGSAYTMRKNIAYAQEQPAPQKSEELGDISENITGDNSARHKEVLENISKQFIGDIPTQVNIFIYRTIYNSTKEPRNRLILCGAPGCGKTALARIIAESLNAEFLSVGSSALTDKHVGGSAEKVREFFEVAHGLGKPVIVFIDEIDGVAKKRTEDTHAEHQQALNECLLQFDSVVKNKNIFLIGATNMKKETLDHAFTSRFSTYEIKILNPKQKQKFIIKIFNDNGINFDQKLVQDLANLWDDSLTNRELETKIIETSDLHDLERDVNGKQTNLGDELKKAIKKASEETSKDAQKRAALTSGPSYLQKAGDMILNGVINAAAHVVVGWAGDSVKDWWTNKPTDE